MIAESLKENPYMNKDVTTLDSSLFNYNHRDNILSQEISCLPISTIIQLKKRIFEDDCGIGFWMQSSRTGLLMLFNFDSIDSYEFGNEIEIRGWIFKSDEGYTLLIIND